MNIPMKIWGKDHWSAFAYAETLAVDGGKKGLIVPDRRRMRTNEKTHPHLVGFSYSSDAHNGSGYPTRLKTKEVAGHDDWDCLDDMVREGLLTDEGTGLNRAFRLTKFGRGVASQLRTHKSEGKNFGEFQPSIKNVQEYKQALKRGDG